MRQHTDKGGEKTKTRHHGSHADRGSQGMDRNLDAGQDVPGKYINRRGRDSNPRYGLSPYSGLANRRTRPLCDPSKGGQKYTTRLIKLLSILFTRTADSYFYNDIVARRI